VSDVELTIKGTIESLRLKPGDVVIATLDGSRQITLEDSVDIRGDLETFFAERGLPVFVLLLNGVTLSKASD
jgi:hypothetical protein